MKGDFPMLNISGLNSGVVIDHIKAGRSMDIYSYLKLDKYDNCVAIIKNARSNKMGKKDIIKIEGIPEKIDLNLVSIICNSVTINIIQNGVIIEKRTPSLPEQVTGIFRCKNPRCITSIETDLPHVFRLTNPKKRTYRCIYCEQEWSRKK